MGLTLQALKIFKGLQATFAFVQTLTCGGAMSTYQSGFGTFASRTFYHWCGCEEGALICRSFDGWRNAVFLHFFYPFLRNPVCGPSRLDLLLYEKWKLLGVHGFTDVLCHVIHSRTPHIGWANGDLIHVKTMIGRCIGVQLVKVA